MSLSAVVKNYFSSLIDYSFLALKNNSVLSIVDALSVGFSVGSFRFSLTVSRYAL